MSPLTPTLLERATEVGILRAVLDEASQGRGQVVVIEGGAGIGKSVLLRWLESQVPAGSRTYRARGHALEQEFPFAGLISLIEPFAGPSMQERFPVLSALLSDGRLPPGGDVHEVFRNAWLLLSGENVERESPAIIGIDDLQWLDEPSQRFVHYAASRVEGHAMVVAATVRTGESRGAGTSGMLELPSAIALRPRPLSASSVAALLPDSLGDAAITEVLRITGGNPLLITEIERSLGSVELGALVTDDIRRFVAETSVARLRRIPTRELELAQAAALLEYQPLALVADAAGMSLAEARTSMDRLSELGVAWVGPSGIVQCSHPLVREAIVDTAESTVVSELHARAVSALERQGASIDRLAPHVARTSPSGSSRAAEILHVAGRRAWAAGDPANALAWLRRAMAEPPPEATRERIELDVLRAEAAVGGETWRRDLDEFLSVHDPADRWRVLLVVGEACRATGRLSDAIDLFREARHDARTDVDDLRILVQLTFATRTLVPVDLAATEEVLERVAAPGFGATSTERTLMGLAAYHLAVTDGPSPSVERMARQAVGDVPDDDSIVRSPALVPTLLALQFCDAHIEAQRVVGPLRSWAQRRGAVLLDASMANHAAASELRIGDAQVAHELASYAVRVLVDAQGGTLPGAIFNAVESLIELDRAPETLAMLRLPGDDARWDESASFSAWVVAAALALEATGSLKEGLARALEAGRRQARMHAFHPRSLPWRAAAIRIYVRLGRRDEASALSAEEVGLCPAGSSPSARAQALRGRALVVGPDQRVTILREASELLAPTDLARDQIWTQVEFGSALRARGDRSHAVSVLTDAHERADQHHFVRARVRAAEELHVLGAAVDAPVPSGPEALTPSERRVAELAARGNSNRDIASQLYVSTKAVEFHLTNAYRKLGISRRTELVGHLGPR